MLLVLAIQAFRWSQIVKRLRASMAGDRTDLFRPSLAMGGPPGHILAVSTS
jgi:hypothetical protein